MTGVIDDRLPAGARHVAVELDPEMAAFLARTHPGLEVIEGDAVQARCAAGRARRRAGRRGGERAAVVAVRRRPRSVRSSTRSRPSSVRTGAFTTFAYRHGLVLSAARRFRRALHETFEEVLVTETVWRNVPPAFVYVCRRPRQPAESVTGGDPAGCRCGRSCAWPAPRCPCWPPNRCTCWSTPPSSAGWARCRWPGSPWPGWCSLRSPGSSPSCRTARRRARPGCTARGGDRRRWARACRPPGWRWPSGWSCSGSGSSSRGR